METPAEVLKAAKNSRKIAMLYDNIAVFARLGTADLAVIKGRLKKIFRARLNLNEFTKAVNEAKSQIPIESTSGLPSIVTTGKQLRQLSEECLDVLVDANNPPKIFQRRNHLVRLDLSSQDGPQIAVIGKDELTGELTRAADFYKSKAGGYEPDNPPDEAVKDILSLGKWRLPYLEGVVETPVLRPDGSILKDPGYDAQISHYYYSPKRHKIPKIPDEPSAGEIKTALGVIRRLLNNFPFANKASKANAFALLLTPIIRPAIKGCVPMAILDAPIMGTGKTFFANTVAQIATGRDAHIFVAPQKNEEEMRKKVTTILRNGTGMILLDDITFTLNSSVLSTVLTSPIWSDRILSTNTDIKVPHRSIWIAAGNNINIGKDLRRRCYWIRLDAKHPAPWKMQDDDFEDPNLQDTVQRKRGKYLAALLTLARAWFVSDESGHDQKTELKKIPCLGGFEKWRSMIGGILAFHGVQDFLGNLNEFFDRMDEESLEWESLLESIYDAYPSKPFTVSDILAKIKSKKNGLDDSLPFDLKEAMSDSLASPSKSFEKILGKAFAKTEGRRFGRKQYHLVRDGIKRRAVLWKVTIE